MSNPEIAAQLFLCRADGRMAPGQGMPKLDISSRRQLERALPGGGRGQ